MPIAWIAPIFHIYHCSRLPLWAVHGVFYLGVHYEGSYFLTDSQIVCLCNLWMPAAVASNILSHNKTVMQDCLEIHDLKSQFCFYSLSKPIVLYHHHYVQILCNRAGTQVIVYKFLYENWS